MTFMCASVRFALAVGWAIVCGQAMAADSSSGSQTQNNEYRGLLGKGSAKIRVEDGKTFLWAGGDPTGPGAQWYDFTGSPIPVFELQYGIGKDRIRAIDDPLFVSPDDPRLLLIPPSRYRPNERPKTTGGIPVIGYVDGSDARAYPVALLDLHELVNDRIGSKPVGVGW